MSQNRYAVAIRPFNLDTHAFKRTTSFPQKGIFFCLVFIATLGGLCGPSNAATPSNPLGNLSLKNSTEGPTQVEITGDNVEVAIAENKVIATGHVKVKREDTTLFCDRLEFSRTTQIATAEGNVVLIRNETTLEGDKLNFDFGAMKGDFKEAEFMGRPFKGAGQKIAKVGENHLHIERGYITTCDLDHPHDRLTVREVDIFPKEKAVARGATFKVGEVPLFYMPKFTQDLRDKKPVFIMTPGYTKDWGGFLLTQYRYEVTERVRATLHTDYRTRRDVGWGVDVNYNSKDIGTGVLKTYYTNERLRDKRHVWEETLKPTVERERYKIEYRHKWEIDPQTMFIGQYHRLSDATFLKDYFEREYDKDTNPPTYALVTHNFSTSTISLRSDVRVNRFTAAVERLPELSYTIPDIQMGESGFYFKDTSTFSNLDKKAASPSEIRQKTMRLDTENLLSYPFKMSFIELRPFVGGRQTYYSRTVSPENYDSVRMLFETGSDVSTKFYRIFDVDTNAWGLNIKRLRHVVTPSVAYFYTHDPSLGNATFDQFDSVDSLSRAHGMRFSLENKLQTKRDKQNVDLVRLVLGSDFKLKEDPAAGGFNNVTTQMDIKPYPWASLYLDSIYDSINGNLQTLNTDLYLQDDKTGRWYFRFGKRYAVNVDDELTTDFGFTINPKWKAMVYQRVDVQEGRSLEQQYILRRDLHCWVMDISFGQGQDRSYEFWMVFTLKDFPELGFDFSTAFHKRKPGARPGTQD